MCVRVLEENAKKNTNEIRTKRIMLFMVGPETPVLADLIGALGLELRDY